MKITHLNHAAFLIEAAGKRIVIDPYDPSFTGMPWKDLEADIVCITHDHQDHNYLAGIKGDPYVVKAPGEYEIAGITIQGTQAYHDDKLGAEKGLMTLFAIQAEGIVVGHFGNLGHELEDAQEEELSELNVLLIPVDGVGSINANTAASVAAQIEPNIIIPMHYNIKGTKTEEWGFAELSEFLKEMGVEQAEPQKELVIKGISALPEETEVVVLQPAY